VGRWWFTSLDVELAVEHFDPLLELLDASE
jgi:hypothetical protein